MIQISNLVPHITEEMIIRALKSCPLAGWPQDEAEMAALFNFMLEDLLVASAPAPLRFAPN